LQGCSLNQPKNIKLKTKLQKENFQRNLIFGFFIIVFLSIKGNKIIVITDNAIAIIPPTLLGIDFNTV
jgi:hypothetical protein